MVKKRASAKPRRIYTPEEKLVITGRKKRDREYVVINLPGVIKDSLKVYAIIHKLEGQAGTAIKHLVERNEEMQTIIKYMKEKQTIVNRNEVIEKMTKGESK